MIVPPALQPGDRVCIISPSSKISEKIVLGQKERLESWGLHVEIAPHALSSYHNFAGTVEQRLADLQQAFDNPAFRALFCSRGGYGAVHLLEQLDLAAFNRSPKWLVGFSDITALHNLLQKRGFQSLHAPMGKHLAQEPADDAQTLRLKRILFGEESPSLRVEGHKLNIGGSAEGILRGGNLSVFYGLRGTPFDIPAPGSLLLIEDVGERPYHIERMMYNLKLGGILPRLSGLIVGQFTEYVEDNAIGRTVYEMIRDLTRPYGYPVCFNFPAGHITANTPLVLGARYRLTVKRGFSELVLLPEDASPASSAS